MLSGILLLVIVLVTYCVASEGAWGAGTTFVSVLLAGLLAMNLFEPLADLLESVLGRSWRYRADFVALVGLFAALVFGLRLAAERFTPTYLETDTVTHEVGRWGLGLLTGYVTMAFLLTALHTAPLPRTVTATGVEEFLGFKAEQSNFFGLFPDRQWLGFTQSVSRYGLKRGDDYAFDGPQYAVGEVEKQAWPSFPLRYAARREELGGVVLSGGGTPGTPGTPGVTPTDGDGGGGLQNIERPATPDNTGGF